MWNVRHTFVAALLAMLVNIPISYAEEVDLELVLAMDASGSISEREYILQLEGTANALISPEIIAAIQSGPIGKIAINVMLWSDAAFPKVDSGWFVLDDEISILSFANLVRTFKLTSEKTIGVGGGGTGIGAGIVAAIDLIENNQYEGLRRTVDVSGDGIETEFWFTKGTLIDDAKAYASQTDVTINGLPIITPDFPDLDIYYRDKVIHGPGAFMVPAKGFEDFARAIRKKLWLEINNPIAFERWTNHPLESQLARSRDQSPILSAHYAP